MMDERFPDLDLDTLAGEQKEFADKILSFSLNGIKGPFKVFLRAPKLGQLSLALGDELRFGTGIEDRLLELAILTHAACWGDQYEWKIHYQRALDKGVSKDVAEALCTGRVPTFVHEDERIIHQAARQLSGEKRLDDAAFAALQGLLGDEGVAAFSIFMGQYALLSTVLAVGQVALPDNDAPLLAQTATETDTIKFEGTN